MEPEKDKLDQWLDHALSDYGHADPRPGIETRILANLAAEKTRIATRTPWPWAFASVAAALTVVVAIWAWMGKQESHRPAINLANKDTAIQQVQPTVATKSVPQVQIPVTVKREIRRQPTGSLELAKTPKLSQFPSVRELSTQERLLVQYAREFPEKALETAQAQAVAKEERISGELAAE